jgi:putative membrane protein
MDFIKNILNGFAFGMANIIPGVSGGTLALIMGFYERLLSLLHSLKPKTVLSILNAFKSGGVAGLKKEWKALDLNFAVQLGIGAVLAVLLLSPLMGYLLKEQFAPTYAFFFGLILISAYVPFKLVKQWSPSSVVTFVIGLASTLLVAVLVDPSSKLISKSILLEKQVGETVGNLFASYSSMEYVGVMLAGFIGISAMLLPGISGSLIMILMGKYEQVLASIVGARKLNIPDLIFLGVFAFGMLIGMVIMSRLISYALDKFSNQTLSFLTGLVLGSLYSLWPFKKFVELDLYKKINGEISFFPKTSTPTNINILPELNASFGISLFSFLVGVAIMLFFLKREISEES